MNDFLVKHAHLSEKSASIYRMLLHGGELHIAQIVKATLIKRSTVYLHIEELARDGLVEKIVRGKRLYYRAASPKRLLSAVERDKQELEQRIPALLQLHEQRHKEPAISTYAGKSGIAEIYRTVEENALWVKTLFAPQYYYMVFNEADSTAFARNLELGGIKMQSLLLNDATSRRLMRTETEFHHVLKLLPKEYILTINIILWSNCVALISYEHLYGVIIENEAIAKYHESQFDMLWGKG